MRTLEKPFEMEDHMMTEEQHYLTKTLNSLQIEKTTLQQQLHVKNDQFQEIQRYLMDYRAELDKFEMYDCQRSMHVIDNDATDVE